MTGYCSYCRKNVETRYGSFCGICGAETQTASSAALLGGSPQAAQPDPAIQTPRQPGHGMESPESIASSARRNVDPGVPQIELRHKVAGRLTGKVFSPDVRSVVGVYSPGGDPVDIDLGPLEWADYVSSRHAEMYPDNGEWVVADLDSSNGTFVDSKRIDAPTILRDGQSLAFANTQFVVSLA